ncbi:hypothetical protein KC323_g107 [Hortaea werneckii]|nr:hypothetical protein KC323_g107 [Hortaea werneckii]
MSNHDPQASGPSESLRHLAILVSYPWRSEFVIWQSIGGVYIVLLTLLYISIPSASVDFFVRRIISWSHRVLHLIECSGVDVRVSASELRSGERPLWRSAARIVRESWRRLHWFWRHQVWA